MTAFVRIGTSGWIYPHWRHRFYPPELPQRRWLEFYSSRFGTVEINYSFYRLPSPASFASWKAGTPADFSFALKGSRFVTHLKRLKDPDVHVATFYERAKALGRKLGVVLWQLPPQLQRDDNRLESFLAVLPSNHPNAIEFRHPSWFVEPVYASLRRHDVALCLADRDGRILPSDLVLTSDWSYLRFHSGQADGDYTETQLHQWADRIADFRARDVSVFAYFNNDWGGYALKNARDLRELVTR
jgi:uncharacterized protein YecE (DUF72 family)